MKTTKQHFELFKKECEYWIDKFGLTEYRIEFFLNEKANGSRGLSEDYGHLMAIDIYFPTDLHKETDIEKIKTAAFHEVCEVLLMRARGMMSEYYNFEIANKEIHTIIRRLENLIKKII
jgi:hypothetical protein